MADKSLADRQTAMRERLAKGKTTTPISDAFVEKPRPAVPNEVSSVPAIFDQENGVTTISRENLYELVWSEPIIKLADRFGVSDVAVAKACRKQRIPLPGRGYWARLAAGQDVSRSLLPEISDKRFHTIRFSCTVHGPLHIKRSEISEIQAERSPEKQIQVADEPTELHPLVRRTLILFSRAKPDDKGLLRPPEDALGLHVSPEQLSRGIAILDALIKTLISRGYAVCIPSDVPEPTRFSYWERFSKWKPFARTQVTIAAEEIRFGLCESTKRVPHMPTREEKRKMDRGQSYGIPESDEVPSGELTLWMDVSGSFHIRLQWKDGARQRVENCLNSFIAGLIEAAHTIKKKRDAAAIEQQERDEEERKRRQREEECRAEEERIRKLDAQMSAWKRATTVRDYAQAVDAFAVQRYGKLDPETKLGQWVSWMRRYADRLDPLTVSDASAG